jgi:glyoxylase-like metal-dependent hydrolase (beta-lactamase superfamily II)
MAREAPPAALELLRHPPDDLLIEFQRGVVLCALRTPTLLPATHTNCWMLDLGPDGGVAVVDPGSPEPAEQARLDRVLAILAGEGRPAREVWLTHHHLDHVGGLEPLAARGLPVRAHPERRSFPSRTASSCTAAGGPCSLLVTPPATSASSTSAPARSWPATW